ENISSTLDNDAGGKLTVQRDVKKMLLVVITSNRGLAGAFNSAVVKKANTILAENQAAGIETEILTIGKKAYDLLRKQNKIYKNKCSLSNNSKLYEVAAV